MVLFNHATREMTAKIVYYGPGLCGKTTNLLVIFDKLEDKNRGKMLSLATRTDRTLFFDLLPVDIGKVGPFNLKIQLYTVPGQVFYNETRKLVLKGADSVVFVADSQPSMIGSNRDSFENLFENLRINNLDPNDMPIVIQYNKRDIPGVLPVEELQEKLGLEGFPYKEASALQGDGVMETFRLVTRLTAKHLVGKLGGKPISRPEPVRTAKEERRIAKEESSRARMDEAATPAPDFSTSGSPSAVAENPFASSIPFAEDGSATALQDDTPPPAPFATESPDEEYETVEEVSLEQLLEGRERPATMAGDVPLPLIADEPLEPATEELDAQPIEEAEEIEELDELTEVIEEPAAPEELAEEEEPQEAAAAMPFAEDVAPEPLAAYEPPPSFPQHRSSGGDAEIELGALRDLQEQVISLRKELQELRDDHQRVVAALTKTGRELTRLTE